MLHSRQAPAPGHGLPRRRLRGSGDDSIGAAPATTAAGGTTAAASQACADAAALKASVAELDQLDPPEAGQVPNPARPPESCLVMAGGLTRGLTHLSTEPGSTDGVARGSWRE